MKHDGVLTEEFENDYVPLKNIVSAIQLKDINPKIIYNFSSDKIKYKLKAASFVSSCSHGLYILDHNQIYNLMLNINQIVYKIECKNPFIIQDSANLNSLITNICKDKMMKYI